MRRIIEGKRNKLYNTQTNVIASIPDFNIILKILKDYSKGLSKQEIKEKLVITNAYGIRTKGSRIRFYTAINSSFLQFKNQNHKDLMRSIFISDLSNDVHKFIAFFQMAINNDLFSQLTKDVLLELLFKGRLTVDKALFISYLYNLRNQYNDQINWTDSTIDTIAYKYLTLMKKLGFLKGSVKKEFCHFIPTDEILILTVYLIKSLGNEFPNLLDNPYSSLLMLSQEGLIERLRTITVQDYLTISTMGYYMKIDLKYSYKDIVDVIRKNN